MAKISIIIPVYNDNKYIGRCFDSLINQTFKDIEIIVVDDGSTDNTPDILKKYQNKDSRIKIITQKNKKQGAARNNGLKQADSEYIMFVDSDDWLDFEYCEKLYNTITKYDADMVISSVVRIKDNGKQNTYYDFKEEKYTAGFNNLAKVTKLPLYWQVWGKLYKKSLTDGIFFEEDAFFEDPEYTIKILHKAKNLVTVPNVKYYYYSNVNSTIKSKTNIAKKIDQINSIEKVFKYIKANNLHIDNLQITKQGNSLFKTKIYTDKIEYYIFGIKVFTKKETYNTDKTILVFNTACFGDVLLCNPLCQNIKKIYPEAKLVFIVDKPFYEAAKNQKDVDEVVIYDKKSQHKGLFGMIKFIKNFKYKNILFSFITYKNTRNTLIAKLLRSKYIITEDSSKKGISVQEKHCQLLKNYTNKKIINYPMQYNINPNDAKNIKKKFSLPEKYIVLCTTGKNNIKDMPSKTAIELIKKVNTETDYKIVFTGAGKKAENYASSILEEEKDFINLVNKTSIEELANIIKGSECLVSIDTGTMHLGCAIKVPTVAIFYERDTIIPWSPNPKLYNSILINENQSAENILDKIIKLTRDKYVNIK